MSTTPVPTNTTIPVVNTTPLTVFQPITADEFIANITANNMTSAGIWTIIGGDDNKNFAIYTQANGSANVRTSDGTTAGGGGGPPPTPGSYSLTIRATNVGGGQGSGVFPVTVQAPGIPIVSQPANFSLTVPATANAVVGTMTATNNPTSWQVASVNPSFANTYFAFSTTALGQLQVTATGATNIVNGNNFTVTVTARNTGGTSSPATASVAATSTGLNDGFSAAPAGAAPWPNVLAISPAVAQPQNKTYATRPPWKVAGVDYNVGPNGTPTKDPATLNGTTGISISGATMTISGSTPIVIDGYDFRLSGIGNKGGYVLVITATNVTIRNCILGWYFAGSAGSQITWSAPANSLTFEYCLFDHRAWLSHNPSDPQGNNTNVGQVLNWVGSLPNPQNLTVRWCWFRGTPNHIVSSTMPTDAGAAVTIDWRFNVLSEIGQAAAFSGGHFNSLQWGGIPANSRCTYQFNLYLYVPVNADNETLQFYPNSGGTNGASCTADVGWNVWIGPNTNPSSFGFPDPNGNPSTPLDQSTWTTLNYPVNAAGTSTIRAFQTTIHNNYMDKSGYPPDPNALARGGSDQTFQSNNIFLITGGVISN